MSRMVGEKRVPVTVSDVEVVCYDEYVFNMYFMIM